MKEMPLLLLIFEHVVTSVENLFVCSHPVIVIGVVE
jgi:hypothetical protein